MAQFFGVLSFALLQRSAAHRMLRHVLPGPLNYDNDEWWWLETRLDEKDALAKRRTIKAPKD